MLFKMILEWMGSRISQLHPFISPANSYFWPELNVSNIGNIRHLSLYSSLFSTIRLETKAQAFTQFESIQCLTDQSTRLIPLSTPWFGSSPASDKMCVCECVCPLAPSHIRQSTREKDVFLCVASKTLISRVTTHAGLGTRRFPTECREKSHSNLALVITGLTWFTQRTRMIQSFTLSLSCSVAPDRITQHYVSCLLFYSLQNLKSTSIQTVSLSKKKSHLL